MRTCIDCGREINRGGYANTSSVRCVVCKNEQSLRGWYYPAGTKAQRIWHEKKRKAHA